MEVRYMGVYWIARKDQMPDDGTVCVFHRKGNLPDNIRFGFYAFSYFREQIGKNNYKAIDPKKIDYWMPIPVFPVGMKCENHREKLR